MSSLAQTARTKIREAFGGSEYPGDDNLVRDSGHDPECRELAAAFRGKAWESISTQMIRGHKDAFPLFTPAAFRYYLPAYLLGCIDARSEVDVAWDSVIFHLAPPSKSVRFTERAEGFTDLQADALVSFLELVDAAGWVEDWEPPPKSQAARARRALEYWRLRARPR